MSAKTERNNEILKAYVSGESLRSIGRRFEVSHEQVRQIVRPHGLHRERPGSVDPRAIEEGRDLFLRGMRLSHAAEAAGLRKGTLRYHLEKSGDYIPQKASEPWKPETYETAMRLKSEGQSAAQIAAVVGKTRNAVLGKIWRASL